MRPRAASLRAFAFLALLLVGPPQTGLALSMEPAQTQGDGNVATRPRVLVIDLKNTGLDNPSFQTLNVVLPSLASEDPDVEVISGEDIRRLVELEEAKQTSGCDDTSCLSEIAGALGAEYVLFGSAGKLGSRIIVTLNLFDSAATRAVGRSVVEVDDISKVTESLRPEVRALVSRTHASTGGEQSGADEGSARRDLLLASAVVAGVGALEALVGPFALMGYVAAVEAAGGSPTLAGPVSDNFYPLVAATTVVGVGVVAVGGAIAAAAFLLVPEDGS